MDETYQIVTFQRDQMTDFCDQILPDIYSELLAAENFDAEGVVAVGAVREGAPCGAAICAFAGDRSISLISIVVDEAERRRGLGRQMVDAAVNEAMHAVEAQLPGMPDLNLELDAEYVLPEEALDGFEAFLRACGFRHFTTLAPVYLLNAADGSAKTALRAFDELPDEGEALCGMMEELDLSIEPTLSFCTADEGIVFVTNPAGEQTYIITSTVEAGVSKADYRAAALSVLQRIEAAAPGATVIFAASAQPYADVIEALAAENGKICRHKTAACYILLRKEVLA